MEKVSLNIICVFVVVAALMIFSSYADTAGKYWPDLSCHEYMENDWRDRGPKEHNETWQRCQPRNNITGPCAKTCVLREYGILHERRRWESDPSKKAVVYNGMGVGKYLDEDLGLKVPDEQGPEYDAIITRIQEIDAPITEELLVCRKKFATRFWERHIMGPCSEWADLLDCLDNAFGCSSKEFRNE